MSKLIEYQDMYIDIVGYDGGDETGFVFQISPDKLSMVYESDGYYETEEEALDDARAVIDVKQARACLTDQSQRMMEARSTPAR